jgi:hypothetical protein
MPMSSRQHVAQRVKSDEIRFAEGKQSARQ